MGYSPRIWIQESEGPEIVLLKRKLVKMDTHWSGNSQTQNRLGPRDLLLMWKVGYFIYVTVSDCVSQVCRYVVCFSVMKFNFAF